MRYPRAPRSIAGYPVPDSSRSEADAARATNADLAGISTEWLRHEREGLARALDRLEASRQAGRRFAGPFVMLPMRCVPFEAWAHDRISRIDARLGSGRGH